MSWYLSCHLPTFALLLAETCGPVKVDSIHFPTIAFRAFTPGWERRHHYFTWKQCRIVWSPLPRFSNEAHLPRPWWAYSAAWRPGGAGFPEGEVVGVMRNQPLVCSCVPTSQAKDEPLSSGSVFSVRVLLVNPSPLWFSGVSGS